MKTVTVFAIAAAVLAAPAIAAPVPFETLRASDFQAFIGNWEGDAPRCIAISSAAEWNAVILPAAVMGAHRPFAPPAGFWRNRTLLLIARTGAAGAGGSDETLRITGVQTRSGRLEVATAFSPGAASYTAKFWTAAALRRPLTSRSVAFTEGGRTLCTVQLTAAQQGAAARDRRR